MDSCKGQTQFAIAKNAIIDNAVHCPSLAAQSSNRAVRLMMSAGRLLEHAAAPPWGEGAQGLEVNAAVRWPQYELSKRLDTRQPAL
jgi:hypothetical protein